MYNDSDDDYEEGNIKPKRVRKIQEKWTSEMVEELIENVKAREALWNHMLAAHKDRNLRDALWEEIADAMAIPRMEITAKWNSLRGSFRAALTRIKSGKRRNTVMSSAKMAASYPLVQSLKFLEPTLEEDLQNTSHLTANSIQSDEDEVIAISELSDTAENPPPPKRNRINDVNYNEILTEAVEALRRNATSDSWDVVGELVGCSGREWAEKFPILASEFKMDIYKLITSYENKVIIKGLEERNKN